MSISIAIRHYFSLNHFAAASTLAKQCCEIESANHEEHLQSAAIRANQAAAIGALISSVAFLEATINEVFADCADNTSPHGHPLPNAALLADMWRQGIPRTASYSVLEKYQIALTLCGKPNFLTDRRPAQDVDALVFARNYMIHFEPEFVRSTSGSEKVRLQRIQSRLNRRFELNRLAAANQLFFPDRALGAGCAKWALSSALAFTDQFFDSLGVPATYSHLLTEIPYSYPRTDWRDG